MEKIKELRERTGAGMVDCKQALDESNGDLEKAIEILRKKGITKAAKRGDREANEGLIVLGVNDAGNEGYIIEVNSETDFVAKNEKFQDFTAKVLDLAKASQPENLEALKALKMEDSSVGETLEVLSGVIGEKLVIGKYEKVSAPTVAAYSHLGGKIGVLVALDQEGKAQLAADVAMQVAAASPRYINPEDVDPGEVEKEKSIGRETLLKEGKPENIIDKILEGKISKYYEDVCLVKQEYIKDDKQKIEQLLGDVKVIKFVRFALEGSSVSCGV